MEIARQWWKIMLALRQPSLTTTTTIGLNWFRIIIIVSAPESGARKMNASITD